MKTKLTVTLLLLMLISLIYLIIRYQSAAQILERLSGTMQNHIVTDQELALLYEKRANLLKHPEQKEANPYDTGILLRQQIIKHNLSLLGYRLLSEKEQTILEFNCKGSSRNILQFIYAIANESFSFKEVVLTDQGRGELQLVFKIYL